MTQKVPICLCISLGFTPLQHRLVSSIETSATPASWKIHSIFSLSSPPTPICASMPSGSRPHFCRIFVRTRARASPKWTGYYRMPLSSESLLKYWWINAWNWPALAGEDFFEVVILGKVTIDFLLGAEGALFIEFVYVVDFLYCALVASAHTDLLLLCAAFSLRLLRIEFLQLFSELVRWLLLQFPVALFLLLVFLKGSVKVLLVVLGLLGMFALDFLLVLCHLLSRSHQFLSVAAATHWVLVLLAAVKFQLVRRASYGEVDVLLLICFRRCLLSASALTAMDLERLLGS